MWKFIKDHIVEELIIAVFALVAFIGRSELEHLNKDIERLNNDLKAVQSQVGVLECQMSAFSADREYESINGEVGNVVLADIGLDSPFLKRLASVEDTFGKYLRICEEGKRSLAQMEALRNGIVAYNNHNFDDAVAKFDSISPPSSLSLRFLGVSFLSKAAALRRSKNPSENAQAEAVQERGAVALENALRLARGEQDRISKEHVISNLICGMHGVYRTDSENLAEIECFEKIVKRGTADHNTYYNLAIVYARTGQFERSIEMLRSCIDADGPLYITKRYVDDEEDFKAIRVDSRWGAEFMALLARFQ